jgi:hypothetical protein
MSAGKAVARGALAGLAAMVGGALVARRVLGSHLGPASEPFAVVSIFDGTSFRPSPGPLAGGRVTSIFGGTSLDLRRTQLPDGGAEITVLTLFGGTDITVPDDWAVEVKCRSVAAGVRVSTEALADTRRALVIKGVTALGGLSVIPRPVLKAAEL